MISVQGELFRRINLNKQRLSDKLYKYPQVFNYPSDWPGDFEGRTILCLISLYKAFFGYQKEQQEIMDQLNEIISHLDEYTNEDGYFGKKFDGKIADEQQISGNSWFLRGLIEYYKITSDKKIYNRIEKIFNNFVFKLFPFYQKYNNVFHDGQVSGTLTENAKDLWLYSSDVGCAFIMLDALGSYCVLTKKEEAIEFAKHLIERFNSINILKNRLQTHATLSFTRGVLKVFETTHEEYLLDLAKHYFNLYLTKGMTLDYSNFNWFEFPESWTEPCCIIDSFIVSHKLFIYTNHYNYLKLCNRIFYNGIRGAQRSNGGAGCNTCLNDKSKILKIHLYEAYFCCTMRLGEGLFYICSHVFDENNDFIRINYLEKSVLNTNNGEIEIKDSIYNSKNISIRNNANKDLYIYIPAIEFKVNCKHEIRGDFLYIPKEEKEILITFDYKSHIENEIHFVGDMILTKKNNNLEYSYITNFIDLKEESALKEVQEL